MASLTVDEVFPLTGDPKYTYQTRDEYEKQVRRYSETGNGLLSVFGQTKTGKSVLVQRVMPNALYVRGDADTADRLWQRVITALEVTTHRSQSRKSGEKVSLGLSGTIKALWANITGRADYTVEHGKESSGSNDDDPATVALRKLLRDNRVLIVDDFHFLPRNEQRKVMSILKGHVDGGGRAVLITATHRAHLVGSLVPNMSGRIIPVAIPLWADADLLAIAHDGFKELGVKDSSGLAQTLVENSFGSPQLMQRLCRALCLTNGIEEKIDEPRELVTPTAGWSAFFSASLSSHDPEVRWIAKLTRGPQERRARNTYRTADDGEPLDGYALIMKALPSLVGGSMELSRDQIHSAVEEMTFGVTGPRKTETTQKLTFLSQIASKPLDDTTQSEESLSGTSEEDELDVDPVLEYEEAGPNSVLRIVDPLFAFALKWWKG